MDVTYNEVNDIAKTLPIGYYAKRRVPVFVDENVKVSTYNVDTDEIHFSYPQIAYGLKNAIDGGEYTKETAIRSMLYHELSHAILSPRLCHRFNADSRIFNIFEDERIETLLANYYLDTNFKKTILYVNGGTIPTPKNAIEGFFNLLRFRMYGDTEFAKRVDEIIEKYADVNGNSCSRGYCAQKVCKYGREVMDLFTDFKKAFDNGELPFSKEEAEKNEQEFAGKNNSNGDSEQDVEKREKSLNKDGQGKGEQDGQNGQNGQNRQGKGEQDGQGKSEQDGQGKSEQDGQEESDGQGKTDTVSHSTKAGGKGASRGKPFNAEEILKNCGLNTLHNAKLTNSLETIISNFNKRNNSGSGCTGYSGVFNPRNVRNEEFRYFDRRISAGGNNKYGSLHLNLFIDNSGSFSENKDAANCLINSLIDVEKRNSNFTFDVIRCGDGLEDTTKETRYIKADEGTSAGYTEVITHMKKHLKKGAFVYNIVMYDGECRQEKHKNCFLGWDRKNVTIIDTGENDRYLKDLKCARIRIVEYGKLVSTLGDEVVQTLQIAFR